MHRDDISGVILAGGRGTRLGGEDKGLVHVADRPMIAYVLERFKPQVGPLFINANRNAARYREFGYPVIEDSAGDFAGPLAGIGAALERCETNYLATAPCDSPFLPEDFVARLAAGLASAKAEIAVAACGGHAEPVFALIATRLAASLSRYLAGGERKIMSWYRQQKLLEIDFGADNSPFTNVNSSADLAAASARLGG